MLRIKNCGLKQEHEVAAAIASGASFIGFVIHPASIRHVPSERAAQLSRGLPATVKSVAVIVDPTDESLSALLGQWRPDYLQLHGHETPERAAAIREQTGIDIIKAIRVADATDLKQAKNYYGLCHSILFDTKHLDLPGGSGHSFDWHLLQGIAMPLPWFVSGGLHAGNVAEAIRISHAPMVDVSTGIESSRGVKDAQKIIQFNETVRAITP